MNEKDIKILYKELKNAIRPNTILSANYKSKLLSYVSDVQNGYRVNPLFNDEYFCRMIYNLVPSYTIDEEDSEDKKDYYENFDVALERIMQASNYLLPNGKESENYEFCAELIINNFVDENGILTNGLFDPVFYSSFKEHSQYLEIMNIIRKNPLYVDNFLMIKKYIINVKKLCPNNNIFMGEILSFIKGLDDMYGDINDYYKDHMNHALRRANDYDIDERTLSRAADLVEEGEKHLARIEDLQEKLRRLESNYQAMFDKNTTAITNMVAEAKKAAKEQNKELLQVLQNKVDEQLQLTETMLNEYAKGLQNELLDASNAKFNELIEAYKQRLEGLKSAMSLISSDANSRMLAFQKKVDESSEKIREAASSADVEAALKLATENEEIRKAIISAGSSSGVINAVPVNVNNGNSEVFVPVTFSGLPIEPAEPDIILPVGEPINYEPYWCFDSRIPIQERIKEFNNRIKERQYKGEVFTPNIGEIAYSTMVGHKAVKMYGESGSGKSYTAEQLASVLGVPYIVAKDIKSEAKILGYVSIQNKFKATNTYLGCLNGGLIHIEEFDTIPSDVQVPIGGIQSAIRDLSLRLEDDPNYIQTLGFAETVSIRLNPNTRLILTSNTSGLTSDKRYNASNKSDERIIQRIENKYMPYNPGIESKLFKNYTEWNKFSQLFREACYDYAKSNNLGLPQGLLTTRDIKEVVHRIDARYCSIDWIIRDYFVQDKDEQYRMHIANYIRSHASYRNNNDIDDIFPADARFSDICSAFVSACERNVNEEIDYGPVRSLRI